MATSTGWLLLLTLPLAALAAEPPAPRTVLLKVFLADFDDVPRPATYDRSWFEELFFGLGTPRATPEGRPMAGSVREYFLDLSEGRLDIAGEVVDWVRVPREITRVPHWKSGMKPFGESWPVIVAETLRAAGITGDQAQERIRLADGRRPDLLVFLNTDWGVGGVNRGWGHCRDVLGRMKLADLWDEAWAALPQPFSSFSATIWRGAPRSGDDGCIDQVPPPEALELFPLSIMFHEMGHQLAGWPDLYTPAYEPWGVFDLMGGPAASTHFPMSASAYLRERSGWMTYDDVPPADRPGLALHPLETHREALRFAQGPGQESIVCENRRCLKYPRDYGQPPRDEGPILLFYRVDPNARRRLRYGDRGQPKITDVIRRSGGYGEVWGTEGHTRLAADTSPSSRNSLGELWWEFDGLAPQPDQTVRFDARRAADDLVTGYLSARWSLADGATIEPGRLVGASGHVGIRGHDDRRRLELAVAAGGTLTGAYALPADAPRRLYVTAEAAEGNATLRVGPEVEVVLAPEDGPRTTVVELAGGALELSLTAGDAPARVLVHSADLVGLAEVRAAATGGETLRLADGGMYGPAAARLAPRPGAPASLELPVELPEEGAVVRLLLAFADSAPTGAQAEASVRLVVGEQPFDLSGKIDLRRAGPAPDACGLTPRNLPAVLAAAVPAEARGKPGRVVLEVSSDQACELAAPYFAVTLP